MNKLNFYFLFIVELKKIFYNSSKIKSRMLRLKSLSLFSNTYYTRIVFNSSL